MSDTEPTVDRRPITPAQADRQAANEINPNFHQEMRVAGNVLHHYATPDASPFTVIRLAAEDALGNLYAKEGTGPTKFVRNRIDAWTMTFRPDPDDQYGGYLITVDAQLGERHLPVTAGEMEAEILRLLMTPREDGDSQ